MDSDTLGLSAFPNVFPLTLAFLGFVWHYRLPVCLILRLHFTCLALHYFGIFCLQLSTHVSIQLFHQILHLALELVFLTIIQSSGRAVNQ